MLSLGYQLKSGFIMIRSIVLLGFIILSACSEIRENYRNSPGHIKNERPNSSTQHIPQPVTVSPVLPLPTPEVQESIHTVVASGVSIKELLFALTRDADLNLDIDDDVTGVVTINAVNQTFSAILDRIARSSGLRYEKLNDVVRVSLDKPFLRNYRIDYLNMARNSSGVVSVSTQLAATGQGAVGASGGSDSSNSSQTQVTSSSNNSFWETLEANIAAIISVKEPPVASSTRVNNADTTNTQTAEAESTTASATPSAETNATSSNSEGPNNNLLVNKEAGIIGVRATEKQHIEISKFLSEIGSSTQRQVLIEATIAEVTLSDSYQAGIDWTLIQEGSNSVATVQQSVTNGSLGSAPTFGITLNGLEFLGDPLALTLRALERFGDVSIVSSPKVMALNNQTALLKVVDNLVYFTVDAEIEPGVDGGEAVVTYESEVHTIPVGFVMTVTPFINAESAVTLNVRPTISRVIGQAIDPNPAFQELGIVNQIPVVQVREVESVLKVNSGDVAIIGGLMQDEVSEETSGVPVLGKMPFVGPLFRYEDDRSTKTELVIFLKPVVVQHASVNGDLAPFQRFLPKTH